ncbi:MAG: hypothetical protein EZS28_013126 [Streblomastix strix]|uniref:Uncharacterized protein n=1 Tax=Streblomastix strix TaxID=222440 RepID=A0A5J4W8V5_9EUKA|nr:MAG: hypothetical protein EZS28_013126 [Streblomastix strix]
MDLIGKNKDFKFKKIWSNLSSFEEWKKSRKNLRQKKWAGSSEDISGDNFPEFVVHDHNGFIRSYHGLRITVPIKCQRITKYFSENLTQEERATTHQKQWKEEDKPADCYRHFIKHYLSPFLKVRGYTVPQVHSVIGGRIWKGINAPWVLQYYDKSYQAQSFVGGDAILLTINRILSKVIKYVYNQYFIAGQSEQRNSQMKRLIQVGYAAFWNCQLSEIPDDANDDEEYIFTVVSEDAIKAAKQQRNEIRANEEKKNIKRVWQKIRVRQVIKFNDGMSLEKARLLPYDVLNI